MKFNFKLPLLLLPLVAFFIMIYSFNAEAGLKYKKETGKKCTFCHVSIPQKGDEDPKLNEDGKLFKNNGYKLTEEQRNKPD
ncbi:MAG: hypothetical protein HY645_01875 [Acidobacteria bacterium]|nr:hypothetical protein [Acidobacteriota bacterium]